MAKKKSSLLKNLESQGRRVLTLIQGEIRDLEGQLEDLRDQAARWASALERRTRPAGRRSAAKATKRRTGTRRKGKTAARKRARRTSPRVDWDAVLTKLPKTFTMADVAKRTPNLSKHPKSRVIALARWSRGKQIKKVGDGKYRKVA